MPHFTPPMPTDDNPLLPTEYRHVHLLNPADVDDLHHKAVDKLDIADQLMVKALLDVLVDGRTPAGIPMKKGHMGVTGARELLTKVAMAKRAYERRIGV